MAASTVGAGGNSTSMVANPGQPSVGELFAIEIPITNLERSQKFYTDLFAWDFAGVLPKATEGINTLHFFSTANKSMKGALLLLEDGNSPKAAGKEGWGVFPTIHVQDVGEAIEKAKDLGGQVKTSVTYFAACSSKGL